MHTEFTKGKRAHLVGIKGVAMTALAQILQARGVKITGSDGSEHFFTDAILKKLGIRYAQQFSPKNIPADVDVVISSAAYLHAGESLGNVEVSAAFERGIPTLTYPQVMSALTQEYKTIGIAGSHGKSTTTAMAGWMLTRAKQDPTVLVGSRVNKWQTNSRIGGSDLFVIEADEYREAFLQYAMTGAVITSIDYDHPDYFKTKAAYNAAYKKLVDNLVKRSTKKKPAFLVVCGDDLQARQLSVYAKQKKLRVLTYGFAKTNDLVVLDSGVSRPTSGAVKQLFHILFDGKKHEGSIPFVGKQYVLNSGASMAIAAMLGLDLNLAARSLTDFPGIARRFELVKQTKQYTIIDDYAHHPTAISITLEGIRAMYPNKRIVAIFQPHMFSRTKALLKEFASSFTSADEVGIMEIYPSARETAGPVKGKQLAAATKKKHKQVTYLPTMASAKKYVRQQAKKDTVIVLMGAGNVRDAAE